MATSDLMRCLLTVSTERHRRVALTLRFSAPQVAKAVGMSRQHLREWIDSRCAPLRLSTRRAPDSLATSRPAAPADLTPSSTFAQDPKPAVGHEACRMVAARAKPGDRGAELSQSRHIVRRCVLHTRPSPLFGESLFLTTCDHVRRAGATPEPGKTERAPACACGAPASPAHWHAPLADSTAACSTPSCSTTTEAEGA